MKPPYSNLPLLLLAVAVQNANASLTAVNDSATTTSGSSITVDVLTNDINTNGGSVFIIENTTTSAYGSVVLNQDNTLTYTPNEGFVGTDSFSYEAQNTAGYGGTATVVVTVSAEQPITETDEELAIYVSGPRNKAVAGMLDQVCERDNNALTYSKSSNIRYRKTAALDYGCALTYDKIDGDAADLDAIIAEIAPDEALIQRRLLADNARNNTSLLYRSMTQLRSGSGGANISINNIALPSGGAAGDEFGSPWTFLSALQLENLERKSTLNEAGYDSKALSLMLGLGYRLGSDINVGAAVNWTNYDLDYVKNSGALDSDNYNLTGFVSWYDGPLSLDIQAGYTAAQTDAQRSFTFPDTATANSAYDSTQLNLSTRLEWAWQKGALSLRPFLRADYLDSDIDGFSETGSSLWLVKANQQSQQQTNVSLGLNTSYTLNHTWGVMTPSLKMSLVSQDNIGNDPVAFQLLSAESADGQFLLKADAADSQFYEWEVSAVTILKNGLSSFISLQTLSDYKNVSSVQISGGINKEF